MSVSFRRVLLNTIEKIGGRSLISFWATDWAKKRTKLDIEIFYDEFWIVRFGDSFLPKKEFFDIYTAELESLRFRRKDFLREPIDHWTHAYTPGLSNIIFDIGAGIGTDSLIFSELVGIEGKVYAFEAHPTSFRRLQKTCYWNQLRNVVQVPYALWSEKATLWISDLEQDVANSVQLTGDQTALMKVEAVDLDTFVEENDIERIDFLKMNIEGAERMAIRGMKRAIKRTKNVAIACHDFLDQNGSTKFSTRTEVIDFLRDANFEILQRWDDPRPYVRDHVYGRARWEVE